MKKIKNDHLDTFYHVKDVADVMMVSDRSVRRWIAEGDLKAHRFGRAIRISDQDLKDFIRSRRD